MNWNRFTRFVGLGAAVLLTACAEDDTQAVLEAPEPVEEPVDLSGIDLGNATLKKLTREQYEHSLRDVFGKGLEVPPTSEPDTAAGGLFAVGASTTPFSGVGVESFENAAFAIAKQVVEVSEIRETHYPCDEADTLDTTCVEEALRTLGGALWRRPLTDEELSQAMGIAQEAGEALESSDEGFSFALATLLQSPNFLYRVELGTEGEGERRAYTGYEMASRLSYFLWNSTPDDELLAAAAEGELDTEDGLRDWATRMLDDPRTREGFKRFYDEYLELEEAEHVSKDPTVFAFFSGDYGPSAAEETRLLLDYLIFDGERDFREFLTTRTTHINPLLAALYDVPAPSPRASLASTCPKACVRDTWGTHRFLHSIPIRSPPR